MQVVGPSVRAFGLCVDGNSTGICEPLSPAMDMLLIPHMPDSFASLATFFSSMPQLVSLAEVPLTYIRVSVPQAASGYRGSYYDA